MVFCGSGIEPIAAGPMLLRAADLFARLASNAERTKLFPLAANWARAGTATALLLPLLDYKAE